MKTTISIKTSVFIDSQIYIFKQNPKSDNDFINWQQHLQASLVADQITSNWNFQHKSTRPDYGITNWRIGIHLMNRTHLSDSSHLKSYPTFT